MTGASVLLYARTERSCGISFSVVARRQTDIFALLVVTHCIGNRNYSAHCHCYCLFWIYILVYWYYILTKQFHRHYSGQPALLSRHYRGIISGPLLGTICDSNQNPGTVKTKTYIYFPVFTNHIWS